MLPESLAKSCENPAHDVVAREDSVPCLYGLPAFTFANTSAVLHKLETLSMPHISAVYKTLSTFKKAKSSGYSPLILFIKYQIIVDLEPKGYIRWSVFV